MLRYVQAVPFVHLPEPMRHVCRIITRWVRRHLYQNVALEVRMVHRWNPRIDSMYDLTASSWLGLLNLLTWYGYEWPGRPPFPLHVQRWRRSCGLSENSLPELLLLRSHITTLLHGFNEGNVALFNRSISAHDPTYVRNHSLYIASIFSCSWARESLPEWSLSLETSRDSSSLRSLFFQAWEEAWSRPDRFFSENNSLSEFLIQALLTGEEDREQCSALSFMIIFFLAFFRKFSQRCDLPSAVKQAILKQFFQDVCCRIAIFSAYDMRLEWVRLFLIVTGSVCSACNGNEWHGDLRPIGCQLIYLNESNWIRHCFPFAEEQLGTYFFDEGMSLQEQAHLALSLYGPEGRTETFLDHVLFTETGGLAGSLAWEMWRVVAFPLLSEIGYDPEPVVQVPYSLLNLSALTVINAAVLSPGEGANGVSYCSLLEGCAFANVYDPCSNSGIIENHMQKVLKLRKLQEHLRPYTLFREALMAFVGGASLRRESSDVRLSEARNLLALVLRWLSFCADDFYECSRVASMVSWVLANLFKASTVMDRDRRALLSLGPVCFAESLWKLLELGCGDPNFSLESDLKDRFIRRVLVLYAVYVDCGQQERMHEPELVVFV